MMGKLLLILQVPLLLMVQHASAQTRYKMVCYFSNWSQYRAYPFRYFPSDIDPFLCTHINYAFARISGTNILPYEWNDESAPWRKGHYEQVMDYKIINPDLKVLLALGGWTHGSGPFTRMLATNDSMNGFIANAITFLRSHKFDGIDIDWEYPGSREGSNRATDKKRFSDLLTAMRKAFIDEGIRTGQERLLLTAAVAAGKHNIDPGYDIPVIGQQLDFVNLMSYDYHGQWDDYVGLNAPLYARAEEVGEQRYLNQNWTVNFYIENGIPREKVIMGLATFGRSFTLQNSRNNRPGDMAVRGGNRGKYTREAGYLAYYEICEYVNSGSWVKQWDAQQFSPYAYGGDQWVGFDDVVSSEIKTQYIIANELGGAMVWELASDDFSNSCGEGRYPLMTRIKSVLNGDLPAPPTSEPTTTRPTTTRPTTTRAPVITKRPTTPSTPRTTMPKPTTQRITTKVPVTTRAPRTTFIPPFWTTTKSPTTRKSTTSNPTTTKPPVTTRVPRTTFIPPFWTTTKSPTTPLVTPKPATSSPTPKSSTTRYPGTTKPPVTVFPKTTQKPTTGGTISRAKPRLDGSVQNFDDLCTEINKLIPYNPDCSKYVHCISVKPRLPVWYVKDCQDGLYFRADTLWCDHPENVPDCSQPEPVTPPTPFDPRRLNSSLSPQIFSELCTSPGMLLPFNPNCSRYVRCVNVKPQTPRWYVMDCQEGLHFSVENQWCDFPENVPDCPIPPSPLTEAPVFDNGRLANNGDIGMDIGLMVSSELQETTPPYERNKPRSDIVEGTMIPGQLQSLCSPGNINLEYNPDCSHYVACVFWGLHFVMPCPEGLYYNKKGYCDWPYNVPECFY